MSAVDKIVVTYRYDFEIGFLGAYDTKDECHAAILGGPGLELSDAWEREPFKTFDDLCEFINANGVPWDFGFDHVSIPAGEVGL